MKRLSRFAVCLLFIAGLGLPNAMLWAQSSENAPITPKRRNPIFRLSGEIGTFGELYSISGRPARRPSSTGRLFFRPTITLFGKFGMSFDITLSTEGSSARQQINQFALNPSWGWGSANLGDFSQDFSRYTLNGISIRGAGLTLNPGILRFQAVGGQTQRAIKAGPYGSAYARYMGGVKLGIGKTGSSFFDINLVQTKDSAKSLPKDIFQRDSTSADTATSGQYGVTAKENIVAGANTEVRLFRKMLTFKGEAAATAYTRDISSTPQDIKGYPSSLKKYFTPRISSNVDVAYTSELVFNHRIFDIKGAYTYVGPGFTSLGISSTINDKRLIEAGAGLRLFQSKISIQGNFQTQNDNVIKQKLFTTTRYTYGGTLNIRPVQFAGFNFNYMQNTMKNDAASDSSKIDNLNSGYSAGAIFQFSLFNFANALSLNYAAQSSKDNNIVRAANAGSDVKSQNISVALTTTINPSWSVSPGFATNSTETSGQPKNSNNSISMRINNRMKKGKLNSSLSSDVSSSKQSSIFSITAQSAYAIRTSDSIKLSVKYSSFKDKSSAGGKFNENTANINYSHKF